MTQEAIPTLRPVPGVDLVRYADQLIERFSNPEVGDTVARLCANASDLIPKFLLPVIRQQLATGGPFTRSAAVVASWARYAEGTDENGETHEMDDDRAPQLEAAAGRQRRHRTAFLEDNRAIFGELADDTRFTRVYSSILTSLHERGVRETFADLDHWAGHWATPANADRDPAMADPNPVMAESNLDMTESNPAAAGLHPDGRERKSS
jgi:mannitol 2-dehydrogenase